MHRAPSEKPPRRRSGLILAAVSVFAVVGTGVGMGWAALSSPDTGRTPYTPVPVTAKPFQPHPPTVMSPQPALPHPTEVVATTTGMTLWGLAQQDCGSGQDWPALYKANRAVVGADPGFIAVGMKLTIKCH